MSASPIIEIKNVTAGYDNRTVLHQINLTIYERDYLGIIGPNGGGNTTLIKCILGLLKPTTGEILHHSCPPSPVSYTHLDVYKRQREFRPRERREFGGERRTRLGESYPESKRRAVSYTHLDVYKRQRANLEKKQLDFALV